MERQRDSPMIGTFEHFRDLHRKGLRLVPLRGKVALLKDWPTLRMEEEEIRHWSEQGVNFGIITGELVVIDTDTDEAEAWVRQQKIDSPVTVRTGGGGLHRYFLTPADIEIHSAIDLHQVRGLDIKAWHSYVVAPGSVHPSTGKTYEYVPGKELVELHRLPIFDVHWMHRRTPRVLLASSNHDGLPRAAGKIRNVHAYIRGITSIQGQGGDRAAFTAACLLTEAGFSPQAALAELADWNETNAFPPWRIDGSTGLKHKVRRAWMRVRKKDIGLEW